MLNKCDHIKYGDKVIRDGMEDRLMTVENNNVAWPNDQFRSIVCVWEEKDGTEKGHLFSKRKKILLK